MHAKYEVSISYGSKVIAKVKVDNRQTDKQTNRQTDRQTDRKDKNNMPPIIRSGGIKKIMKIAHIYFKIVLKAGNNDHYCPGTQTSTTFTKHGKT